MYIFSGIRGVFFDDVNIFVKLEYERKVVEVYGENNIVLVLWFVFSNFVLFLVIYDFKL